MSTANNNDAPASPLIFSAPYALGIFVQLPLLLRYSFDLLSRPHYGLFLLAILASVTIALIQWPWQQSHIHRATIKSTLFAVFAVASGVAGAVLGEPWFAALSVVFLVASYFSATVNREGLHSIGYAVLPLFAFLRPPLNWDLGINTRLQEWSIDLASKFMYILGPLLIHNRDDAAFSFLEKGTFLHTESLIRIGSVYTLIFVAFAYAAVNRRNFFQTVLLVASCFLWTTILNTTYLMLLPFLNYYLEIELVAGTVAHNMVRVLLLLGTALMIFSTGELLNFVFSPVDPEIGRSYEFGRFITAIWNNLLAGRPFVNETGQIVGRAPQKITKMPASMTVRWIMGGVLAITSILPLISSGSYTGIGKDDVVSLSYPDMPELIDDWAVTKSRFQTQTFTGSNSLGWERETWTYQSPDMTASCSIAEPFNMWHELTKIHQLRGWDREYREVSEAESWPFVTTGLVAESGEMKRIHFCYFDAAGNPVSAPSSDSIRGQISSAMDKCQPPLYQVALTHSHFNELTQENADSLTQLFLKFRQAAKERVILGATAKPAPSPSGEPQVSELDKSGFDGK